MTCRKCKYEFCWLCLGDYKKHQAETGSYLCGNYEDVKKAGRANTKADIDKNAIERDLKKMEFYSNRYQAHQGSVPLSEKHLKKLLEEIDFYGNTIPNVGPNDF